MLSHRFFILTTAALLLLPLAGHGMSNRPDKVAMEADLLYTGGQCVGDRQPSARWIDSPEDLDVVRSEQKTSDGQAIDALRIDFEADALVWVDMGEKSTAGYRLGLHVNNIVIEGETARVTLSWMEPPPGSLTAQIITHPCALIRLPRGNYSVVELVDQNQQLRFKLQAPNNR